MDLLTGAELRIKPGACYGLIGRNGTGKSSKGSNAGTRDVWRSSYSALLTLIFKALLRTIADKLIPGVAWNTRIALLQQTSEEASSHHETSATTHGFDANQTPKHLEELPALRYVVESDVQRFHYQRDVEGKSKASYSLDPSISLSYPYQR